MVKCKHVNKITTFALGIAALFLTAIGSSPDKIPAQENENPEPVVEYVTSDVEIIWNDSDNQDGIRPDSLNVCLTTNGEYAGNVVLNAENGWNCSFEAQRRFDDAGMEKAFSVNIEDIPDDCGYTFSDPAVSYDEGCHFTITALHETEKQSLSARIAWIDEDNKDGLRPDTVTFNLYADGALIDSRTASSENTAGSYSGPLPSSSDNGVITGSEESDIVKNNADNFGQYLTNGQDSWEISFGELPVNRNGHPIMYSVRADGVEGYDLKPVFTTEYGYSFPGAFFAAVHEPTPKTGVTVSMIWNDSDNADHIRPASVHTTLIADGSEDIAGFDLSEDNNWTCTAENIVSVNTDGSERSFSITTDTAPDGYSYSVDRSNSEKGPVFTITGTHEHTAEPAPADHSHPNPASKISVTVSMAWNDSENNDRLRPSSVHASLIADGNGEAAGFILSENSSWTLTIDDIDATNPDGSPRAFSLVTDDSPDGYSYSVEKNQTDAGLSFIITGTHQHTSEPTPSEPLPSDQNPAIQSPTIRLTAGIAWDDCDNADRIRPASLHARFVANDTEEIAAFDLTADRGWAFNIDKVESSNADGSPKSFTLVMDDAPAGYTYSEKKITTENGLLFTITAKHEPNKKSDPESVLTTISGMIIWDDANDKDRIKPSDLTVYLEGNGQTFNMTASGDSDWKDTFSAIPKYDTAGNIIPYLVSAKAVNGYATTTAGYNLVNTHEPDKAGNDPSSNSNDQNQSGSNSTEKNTSDKQNTSKAAPKDSDSSNNNTSSDTVNINGRKVWDDQNDVDRIRPSSITVKLYADGTQVKSAAVTSDSNWVYSFTNMPKYSSGRNKITYTVDEDDVSGYTKTINGYTIVNTHLPSDKSKENSTGREKTGTSGSSSSEKININGTKTWVDNNNAEKVRPDYIIVHLFADGTEKRVTTVTENNGWVYSFPNMPKKNESGETIKYTVDEDDVSGYKKTVTGYNIVNTLSSLAGSDEEKEAIDKASKESSQKESSVQTGDRTPISIMIACLVASSAVIAIFIIKSHRNSKGHNSDRFAGTT